MTNLVSILASIITSLSTNVVTTDNAKYEIIPLPCPEGRIGCLVFHSRRGNITVPATERIETEVVTEQHYEIIPAHGVNAYYIEPASSHPVNNPVAVEETRRLVFQREISRVSRTYKLDQQWKLSDVNTNASTKVFMLTNIMGSGISSVTNWILK